MSKTVEHEKTRESEWWQQAWLIMGCITVLFTLTKALTITNTESNTITITNTESNTNISLTCLNLILAGLAGYVLADLTTGIYHWIIDNYGSASTPFFGNQIQLFQIHHNRPSDITTGGFAHRNYALGQAITFLVFPMALKFNNPVKLVLLGTWAAFVLFCQQTHSWAHCAKDKLPRLVVALQDSGLLLSRFQHMAHHKRPYNNNYCIVSGIWNGLLDKYEVFMVLEKTMFSMFQVQPRSWSSQPKF